MKYGILIYYTIKNLIALILCILIIQALVKSNNTISEFNNVVKNFEDTSQTLLIDSLQLEIMDIGSKLDSMHLKYDE
jgi:hypothetical protein|tara:strand:- start:134 stop:364 length:231 start_codon:yes stop_codon:yes gene_type:complete